MEKIKLEEAKKILEKRGFILEKIQTKESFREKIKKVCEERKKVLDYLRDK
jgi:hypothetical protein